MVWRIGDPALGPRQFAADWFLEPGAQGPVFEVGRSQAAQDWPQQQPGPLDTTHGFAPATVEVVFTAGAEAAAGWYGLEVSTRASHGPCPDLLVEVNGRTGVLALEPERRDRSAMPVPPGPIAGRSVRCLALPPGTLQPGRNRLRLTTVAREVPDPAELVPPQLPPLARWFGSALSWESLALLTLPGPVPPEVRLVPTPLYTDVDAVEHEVVHLVVSAAPLARCSAEVAIGSWSTSVQLQGHQLGDERVVLHVPSSAGPVPASVRVAPHDPDGPVLETTFRPSRRWTLHLVPHVHLDVGYTDRQAKVLELHHRNVDRALRLMAADPEFRYTIDGGLVLEGFLRSRRPEQVQAALAALRSGRLSVNAFSSLFLSGVASLEEVFRAAAFSGELRRRHDLPAQVAWLTDVPSYSWAMPSAVAALGIDAFIGIQNHSHGANADSDVQHLQSPARWVGPDGGSVLAFFADSYAQLRYLAAEPPTVAGAADGFVRFLDRYDRDEYLPEHLPIVGTQNDNEDLAHGYLAFVRRWNQRYTWPRLRFSSLAEYVDAVRPLVDRLPVLRGDGGSYWEDGVGAAAGAAAAHRRAQALLPAAEGLSALVAAVSDALEPDLVSLDASWARALLAIEHTWTSAHATSRPHSAQTRDQLAWKLGQVEEAGRAAHDLAATALSQLAEAVSLQRPALLVANTLPWSRTVPVQIELDESVQACDSSGATLVEDRSAPVDGVCSVELRVADVPPFGYVALPLRPDPARPPRGDTFGIPTSAPTTRPAGPAWDRVAPSLSTRHYDLELDADTGGVLRMVHRATGRQLADPASAWLLGQVLHVCGGGTATGRGLGSESTRLSDGDPQLAEPQLTITAVPTTAVGTRRTPWGQRLEAFGRHATLRVEVRWTFPDDDDRVELEVLIDKADELAKESVYVAFPFLVPSPTVRYDRQLGWVDPAEDHLPGACGEWFTAADAVTVSGPDGSVAWASADAPLFALGDVVRGRWPTAVRPASGTVLSWVMNNYWGTNTPASQSGQVRLRYAWRPTAVFDPAAASRLGRELRAPLLAQEVTYHDRGDSEPRALPSRGRLLDLQVPASVDVTVLAGRRRPGLVLRLRELTGAPAVARVRPLAGTALLCSADEAEVSPVPPSTDGFVEVELTPYAVVTLALPSGDRSGGDAALGPRGAR